MEADQEDLKCLLAVENQERTVRVIGSLSTLVLIWKVLGLDLGLRENPTAVFQGGDVERLKLSSSNGD